MPSKTAATIILLLALGATAKADECDQVAGSMMSETPGLKINRRTDWGYVIFDHPRLGEVSLACPRDGFPVDVMTAYGSSPPPTDFAAMSASVAAAALGVPHGDLRAAVSACLKKALRDESNLAAADRGSAHVECQSLIKARGGSSITMSRRTGR